MTASPNDGPDTPVVVPVAEARAGLSTVLRDFRVRGAEARPVVIGSHRKPEAVLVPYAAFASLSTAADGVPGIRERRATSAAMSES